MTARPTPRILLTGFGPFPGTPVNASALLVEHLAAAARRASPAAAITTAVLPTEWERGPAALDRLWAACRPDIAIHFGVSDRARGFVIETQAHNHCRAEADACGALPAANRHVPDGPGTYPTMLPTSAILLRLAARAIPCCSSTDAGAYLCNAIFYRSVVHAAAADRRVLSGFVHIPTCLAGGGPKGHDAEAGCALSWDAAVAGGQEIIAAACGDYGAPRRWPRPRAPHHG